MPKTLKAHPHPPHNTHLLSLDFFIDISKLSPASRRHPSSSLPQLPFQLRSREQLSSAPAPGRKPCLTTFVGHPLHTHFHGRVDSHFTIRRHESGLSRDTQSLHTHAHNAPAQH
ncbi:hypothetical protein A4X09_0g7726 [Tilletia walkeri]|uniref:Uncharacterized protein n=1 Tax=Tilletia walkeri TaxID=117179 RepID=A0A8X7T125_9BASI|nr:hypothetical protein A4X09_0g7726 [Tilletia walkeri]